MSDGVKVGSFRWLGNLGDQIVVKDVGFKPRFIFFWAPTSDIENGGTGATYFAFAGVDNAGAIQNAGISQWRYTQGDQTFLTIGNHSLGRLTGVYNVGYASLGARVISMDTDGFTIDSGGTASAYLIGTRVHYMAIYGPSSAYCKIKRWATNTSSGNQVVNAGTASAPSLVIHLSCGSTVDADEHTTNVTADRSRYSIGMMTSAAQWALANGVAKSGSTTTTNRRQSTSHAIAVVDDDADTEIAMGTYVSMDTAGFTVNFASGPAVATQMISICIVGLSTVRLGAFNKPTGAAPVNNSVSGIGIAPDGVMFLNTCQVTSGTVNPNARVVVGASDGVMDCVSAHTEKDAVVTTAQRRDHYHGNQSLLVCDDDTYTAQSLGYVATLDATGFTNTWNVNNAVATEILYLAIQSDITPITSGATSLGTTGTAITRSAVAGVFAMPTVADVLTNDGAAANRGALWVDTSTDPVTIRVADGTRFEKIIKPYATLLDVTAGGASIIYSATNPLITIATFAIEDLSRWSGLEIYGSLAMTAGSAWLYVRLNGNPDSAGLWRMGPLTFATEPVPGIAIRIPPFSDGSMFPRGYNHFNSGATPTYGASPSINTDLLRDPNYKISSVDIVVEPLASFAAITGSFSLFETPRDFYDYTS